MGNLRHPVSSLQPRCRIPVRFPSPQTNFSPYIPLSAGAPRRIRPSPRIISATPGPPGLGHPARSAPLMMAARPAGWWPCACRPPPSGPSSRRGRPPGPRAGRAPAPGPSCGSGSSGQGRPAGCSGPGGLADLVAPGEGRAWSITGDGNGLGQQNKGLLKCRITCCSVSILNSAANEDIVGLFWQAVNNRVNYRKELVPYWLLNVFRQHQVHPLDLNVYTA